MDAMTVIGLVAGLPIAAVVLRKAFRFLASKLPPKVTIDTHHEWLDKAGELIVNGCIDELRAILVGPMLDEFMQAAATGNVLNVERVLFKDGDQIANDVFAKFGPVVGDFLAQTIGVALKDKIKKTLISKATGVATENAKELGALKSVTVLADGRKVVAIAPPEPPEIETSTTTTTTTEVKAG